MSDIALQLEKMKSVDRLLPPRGPSAYAGGYKDADKGYVKYGPPSTKEPTLILKDYLNDDDGNIIPPGFYELALSYDREFLLLTQSQKLIAVIPVFKLEEDKSQLDSTQPMDKKSLKKVNKEKAKKAKKEKKLKSEGKIIDEPEVYSNATIEYQADGDYYLIKYERGGIRAWGAIKL